MFSEYKSESSVSDTEGFLRAYRQFRETVDFEHAGSLPECDNLVWYLVMGIPEVPADHDSSQEATLAAIEQRVAILKAVFVEVNAEQPDAFLDAGLRTYDRAARMAREMLRDVKGELP